MVTTARLGMPLHSLNKRDRRGPVALARFFSWAILWQHTYMNQTDIAELFERDDTAVHLGLRRLRNRLETEPRLRETYDSLCSDFRKLTKLPELRPL